MARRDQPTEAIGTLADHVGRHFVALHCGKCGHYTQNDPADLADRLTIDYPMARLARNASCSNCGHKGASLTISAPSTPTVIPQPRGWCLLEDRAKYAGAAPPAPSKPLSERKQQLADRLVAQLRQIATLRVGQQKGTLWMDTQSRTLRAKPAATCVDQDSYQRCLDALELDLKLKVSKRDRDFR